MRRKKEREKRGVRHSFVFSFFFCKRSATGRERENPFPFLFTFSSSASRSFFAKTRWRKRRKKREVHAICLLGENGREKKEERKGVMPDGEDIREGETKDAQELDGEA